MNCYECAIEGDALGTVAICKHCGAGMCLEHFRLAQEYRVGGTTYGCSHRLTTQPSGGARKRVAVRLPKAASGVLASPAASRRARPRPVAAPV